MGLLDFLKGKGGGGRGAHRQGAAAGAGSGKAALGLSLPELEKLLAEREAGAAGPFVEKGGAIARKVVSAAGEATAAARALAGAKPTGQWSKIGEEMKRNFLERVPSALALEEPRGKGLDELAAFRSSAVRAMASASKIVSDNRYLFHFFPGEMAEFGRRANATVSLVGELEAALSGGDEAARPFRDALAALGAHARLEEEKRALEKELRGLGVPMRGGGEAGASVSASRLAAEKELAALEGRAAALRSELASAVVPLERPLRKLEKTAPDRKVASAAAAFASDAVSAVVERGAGDLRLLAGELGKALERGGIEADGKKRERLAGHLARMDFVAVERAVGGLRSLTSEREGAEAWLRAVLASERAAEEAVSSARALEAERTELGAKVSAKGGAARDALVRARELAGKALGVGIKIPLD